MVPMSKERSEWASSPCCAADRYLADFVLMAGGFTRRLGELPWGSSNGKPGTPGKPQKQIGVFWGFHGCLPTITVWYMNVFDPSNHFFLLMAPRPWFSAWLSWAA